jgi:hypothetical protein
VLRFGAIAVGVLAALAVSASLATLGAGNACAQGAPTEAEPRVFHVPTAWIQPDQAATATLGLNHHGEPFADATVGLGGIAQIGLQLSDDSEQLSIPTGLFQVAVPPDKLWSWQPAVALVYRRSFAVPAQTLDGVRIDPSTARLSLVASLHLGSLALHAGADLWDASVAGAAAGTALDAQPLTDQLRPLAGLEWRPSLYPRTTVLADLAWAPDFSSQPIALRWLASTGVRYAVTNWADVELGVQVREGEGLRGTAVLLRISAFYGEPTAGE